MSLFIFGMSQIKSRLSLRTYINVPKLAIGNNFFLGTIECNEISAFLQNVKIKHGFLIREGGTEGIYIKVMYINV